MTGEDEKVEIKSDRRILKIDESSFGQKRTQS